MTKVYTLPFGVFISTSNDLDMSMIRQSTKGVSMRVSISLLVLKLPSYIFLAGLRQFADAGDVDLDHL